MPLAVRRLLVVVLLAVLVPVGLAACGGGGKPDATVLIKDTFGKGHPIRSGRADVTLDIDLQGLASAPKPYSLHLSGPFQSNGGKQLPDFAFDVDLNGGQQPITVGAIFSGGAGFLTIEGQAFDIGPQLYAAFKQGYLKAKADSASRGDAPVSLKALGIDPAHWLKDPKDAGSEDIAGTSTEHVTSSVDVPRLLDDLSTLLGKARGVSQAGTANLPSQLSPQQREEIARSVKSATVDVWTGEKDHTLRRIALNVELSVPKDLQAQIGGLRGGHIGLDATLAQLNEPQRIVKPAGARPLSDLRGALQQLGLGASAGGSGASGGSGGSGGSSSSSSGPGPSDAYSTCLQKAGNDLAKVQQCATLLK